jgi:hypothetical protein
VHLFFELFTLGAFIACWVHAARRHGRAGAAFYGALVFLGAVREVAVAAWDVLYGFAPLTLMLGPAPVLAAIIWAFSIYAAVTWVERVTGRGLSDPPDGPWPLRAYLLAALFMMALAGFYEPFLELVGMAQWEPGTRATGGVPWIALIGYPTLTVGFLVLWRGIGRVPGIGTRWAVAVPSLVALAVGHGLGLQALKSWLGW